ncbi:aspartate kinase [Mesoterricola sediminis]|uniref:Aspartokinase n=1 Tax=Mesoterricola sediminis TaxID=2927980 RepID=A0AA48KBN3_9BACT|nr:aspartate kinase [Mesoterricola sediminis]BDU75260.1 aspartokinase [Mesoterricola sediminis]
MKVLKFGGTSVGSREAQLLAARIIARELPAGGLVVVSALSGTTDLILKAMAASARGDLAGSTRCREALEARHWEAARALDLEAEVRSAWAPLFQSLSNLLQGMGLLWEASPRSRDTALAVGETLSARLMAALLVREGLPAAFRDVREVLRTDGRHGRARPDLEAIREAAAPWRAALGPGALWVTQGFLGQGPDGATTTLGRGGSDTSATLLGEALGAAEVQIWTDVDGVLSADPSLVPGARPIPVMSLPEAAALSAFGAKVLHADALAPVRRAGFRLVVANTHRPSAGRTEIRLDSPPRRPGEITSVAYKEGVSCLRVPPTADAEQLFQASTRLLEAGASLYGLLATPDGGLLVARAETAEAEAVLTDLAASGLDVSRGWAVVALVGEGLRAAQGRALSLLGPLVEEPVAAILAGDTGVSLAFLVPDPRLAGLIPRLHATCIETPLGV